MEIIKEGAIYMPLIDDFSRLSPAAVDELERERRRRLARKVELELAAKYSSKVKVKDAQVDTEKPKEPSN